MTNEFICRLVLAKRDREPLQGRSRPKVSRVSLPGGVWNAVRSLGNIQISDLMKLLGRVRVGQPGTVLVERGGNS
jgi:hypothetical protein